MVACPKTLNYVYLNDEVKQKIASEEPTILSDLPQAYEVVDRQVAIDKALGIQISMENKNILTFDNLN